MSWFKAGVSASWLLAMGCSSSTHHASGYVTEPGTGGRCTTCTSSSGGSSQAGSAAGGGSGTTNEAGGSAGSPVSSGVFSIRDLADAPCVTTTAPRTVVMEPEPLQLVYDQIGHVSERVFAFDSVSLALFTFDREGAEPSPIRYDNLLAVAAAEDRLAVLLENDSRDLVLELTDDETGTLTKPLTLAMGSSGSHELAVGPELLLTLRRVGSHLQGELIQLDGQTIYASFDLGAESCGEFGCKAAALWNGGDFTVVWSRTLQNGRSKLSWVRVDARGGWQFPRTVALSDEPLELVDAVRLPNGYALLLTEGSPAEASIVAQLDEYGILQGAALRLLGAREAWRLAQVASTLGVVAGLGDGRAAFRPLSLSGEALSDWVCLDDSAPDIGFSARAALASDETGFDFVVRMTDGSATYLRTNELGMRR